MKKTVLRLAVLVAIISLLVGGTTLAIFTSVDTNSAAGFAAGTVQIDAYRNAGDTSTGPMFYTTLASGGVGSHYPTGEWKPGDSHARYLNVQNVGSLDVKMTRIQAEVTGLESDPAAYAEFISQLKVKVEGYAGTLIAEQPLANFLGSGAAITASEAAKMIYVSGISNLKFTASLDINADNDLQGKSPMVSFIVVAEQAAHN